MSSPIDFLSSVILDWSYGGLFGHWDLFVLGELPGEKGTVEPVSKRIRRTSSVSPKCTILVITSTGPLLGKGRGSVDLTLKCLDAVFFEGPPSSSWLSLESSSSALDRERFLVMAIVWSPAVNCRSSFAGKGDLRENPACRCPGFPNRTLPPRPSSGWLRF